jgi:hypothetical protein
MPYASSPEVQAYLDLKAQVEALRKQAEAEGPYEARPDINVTPSGGQYAPAQMRVSYGNILSNALGERKDRQSRSNLSDLEAQMEQARIAALRGLSSGERSVARAADLERVGATSTEIEGAKPEAPPSMTSMVQSVTQNPAMLPFLRSRVTPEQYAELEAAVKASAEAKTTADVTDFEQQKELRWRRRAAPGRAGLPPRRGSQDTSILLSGGR